MRRAGGGVSLGRSVDKGKAGQLSLDGFCVNRLAAGFGGFSKTSPKATLV